MYDLEVGDLVVVIGIDTPSNGKVVKITKILKNTFAFLSVYDSKDVNRTLPKTKFRKAYLSEIEQSMWLSVINAGDTVVCIDSSNTGTYSDNLIVGKSYIVESIGNTNRGVKLKGYRSQTPEHTYKKERFRKKSCSNQSEFRIRDYVIIKLDGSQGEVFKIKGFRSGEGNVVLNGKSGGWRESSLRKATSIEILASKYGDEYVQLNLKISKDEVQSKSKANRITNRSRSIKARCGTSKITSRERLVGNEIKIVTRRAKVGRVEICPTTIIGVSS